MRRRTLLKTALAAAAGRPAHGFARWTQPADRQTPQFHTTDAGWQAAYDKALAILAGNVRVLPRFDGPVLIEGAEYRGIWQECGPLESLVYSAIRPDVARNSHMIFFALQRADGQLPANNKLSETGFGQIQMVVPIAATAWELARRTGDAELLQTAYRACSRWDAWLLRYRNTRGTGLVEGFCTYDTGMDNSPRWAGIPPQCPGKDATRFAPLPTLPRLCPDLSATVYGGRVALAAMAEALGRRADSEEWSERAETLRRLITTRLYVPEDGTFYDLDAQGRFVRVLSCVPARVCGEHVVDQATFEEIWRRQLGNPSAFWAPFPLPSSALAEPTFVRPIVRNCWGGPSQALTALRAGRWMEHYGRAAEYAHLMEQWCTVLVRDPSFRQQIDPLSGDFTPGDSPGYSPAALLLYNFTWRLAGVRAEGDELHWNVRPGIPAMAQATFRLPVQSGGGDAVLRYRGGGADLTLSGRPVGRVEGMARLVTDQQGRPRALLGTALQAQNVRLQVPGHPPRLYTVLSNQRLTL